MRITSVRTNMRVYHPSYGIVKVLRKAGSRVIVERPVISQRMESVDGDEDDDEEDYLDNEVSVNVHDLIPEKEMSPELRERAEAKRIKMEAEQKEKEAQQREWLIWKDSLPEIPKKVENHLKNCCKDGMMSFLTFLHTDPDALEKLKQHSLFILREEMISVEKEVPALEQDLSTKKDFLGMMKNMKPKLKKGVKLAHTA